MAKNKGARIIISLECTECRVRPVANKRSSGCFRYTTTKNRRNTTARLEIRKFCPHCNIHSVFKELK